MEQLRALSSSITRCATGQNGEKLDGSGRSSRAYSCLKKRGHGSRSWIRIDSHGNSQILELDKAALMRRCSLPGRDLRLLDPLFVYPSTILGREKAIVVNLEQVRCIVMADEVILINSLDGVVQQFESDLCKRLRTRHDQSDDLAFEFRALELALELACTSLDAQVTELEAEIYPVLETLTFTIRTTDLEHVRRLKSSLLTLTHRVQKVRDEIEHLMDDDGDMAEMYLSQKKERTVCSSPDRYAHSYYSDSAGMSRSVPVSPVRSLRDSHNHLVRPSSRGSSNYSCGRSSCSDNEHTEELEMLLEVYFVVIDSTLSKLLSIKEYIYDTEDFINIKLDNTCNQLIQFELLLTAATFVAALFAVVTGIFGMNFDPPFFDQPKNFSWVLLVTSIFCMVLCLLFLAYVRAKRLLPM